MCIAILNKSAKLSKKSLQNCWDNNYHGAGIGYVDGNSIRSYHEGTSFESFYEEYQFIRNNSEHPLMLHFRIATHGKGTDMLHPHSVAEGKVFPGAATRFAFPVPALVHRLHVRAEAARVRGLICVRSVHEVFDSHERPLERVLRMTPGESGTPSVAAEEPAATSR
jgi:hypothetical protein